MNFVRNVAHPMDAIRELMENCRKLEQLSLCRFFDVDIIDEDYLQMSWKLLSASLQELDLLGNYFSILPMLPAQLTSIRLSLNGDEHVDDLCEKLKRLKRLRTVRLSLACTDQSYQAVANANGLLARLLPLVSPSSNYRQKPVIQIGRAHV